MYLFCASRWHIETNVASAFAKEGMKPVRESIFAEVRPVISGLRLLDRSLHEIHLIDPTFLEVCRGAVFEDLLRAAFVATDCDCPFMLSADDACNFILRPRPSIGEDVMRHHFLKGTQHTAPHEKAGKQCRGEVSAVDVEMLACIAVRVAPREMVSTTSVPPCWLPRCFWLLLAPFASRQRWRLSMCQ